MARLSQRDRAIADAMDRLFELLDADDSEPDVDPERGDASA